MKRALTYAPWVENLKPEFLATQVRLALIYRAYAMGHHARAHDECNRALRRADKVLDDIRNGRLLLAQAISRSQAIHEIYKDIDNCIHDSHYH